MSQMNYACTNSNLPEGWAHMFLAHLAKQCGFDTLDASIEAMNRDANDALSYAAGKHSNYQSDNQCVMMDIGYPVADLAGLKIHMRDRNGQVTKSFDIDIEAFGWWLVRI